jgi:hypothetical protein
MKLHAKLTRANLMATFAALAVVALGLSACGGSGSSSSSTTGSTISSSAGEEAVPSSGAEGAGAGGLTPAGTEIKVGESATVIWVPSSEFETTKAQTGIELEATVEAIEEGKQSDLDGLELEAKEKGSVPFYVRLKLEAPTDKAIPAEEDPAVTFTAIDDRGEEQGSVIFLGTFPPCEEKEVPMPFDGGASYETCSTYLMKGGGSIEKVEWNSGPAKANEVTPYFEHPVVWGEG